MKTFFKIRPRCFVAVLLLVLCVPSLSANEVLEDSVFLQGTPIFEGEAAFMAKMDEIRKEREPLGLVLSGGSARAYAHIGVLREFEKRDIKPDFIVANSMGAIIGLLYASGFSPDDIEYIVTTIDLNSLFDLVFPLEGGFISQRYFEEGLLRLFPNHAFDIRDSLIPIIIPAEDMVTKRLVLFAEGSISKVMTAAFVMPILMNPVAMPVTVNGNIQTASLLDAGAVDLGSITVAERVSKNLIISTALYDKPVNLKNPTVIIQRGYSIIKERILVLDMVEKGYPYIRNDVEGFSFMDFSKVKEIITCGENSAKMFFDGTAPKTPAFTGAYGTWSQFVQENPTAMQVREERSQYAKSFVHDLTYGRPPYSEDLYIGVKVRPNIPVLDMEDMLLNERVSVGAYLLADYRPITVRLGVHTSLSEYGADLWARYRNDWGLSYLFVASADAPYQWNNTIDFYLAQELRYKLPVTQDFVMYPFITGEYGVNANFSSPAAQNTATLFARTGIKLDCSWSALPLVLTPYAYLYRNGTSGTLFDGSPLTDNIGFGATASVQGLFLPVVGVRLADSFRYQKNGQGTGLLSADEYRGAVGKIPALGMNSVHKILNVAQAELFTYSWNTGITAAELMKLEKIRAGLYYDCALAVGAENTVLYHTAGFCTRAQISLAGLITLNGQFYLGYDFNAKGISWGLTLVNRW